MPWTNLYPLQKYPRFRVWNYEKGYLDCGRRFEWCCFECSDGYRTIVISILEVIKMLFNLLSIFRSCIFLSNPIAQRLLILIIINFNRCTVLSVKHYTIITFWWGLCQDWLSADVIKLCKFSPIVITSSDIVV